MKTRIISEAKPVPPAWSRVFERKLTGRYFRPLQQYELHIHRATDRLCLFSGYRNLAGGRTLAFRNDFAFSFSGVAYALRFLQSVGHSSI
jgi:hypothetical protein